MKSGVRPFALRSRTKPPAEATQSPSTIPGRFRPPPPRTFVYCMTPGGLALLADLGAKLWNSWGISKSATWRPWAILGALP